MVRGGHKTRAAQGVGSVSGTVNERQKGGEGGGGRMSSYKCCKGLPSQSATAVGTLHTLSVCASAARIWVMDAMIVLLEMGSSPNRGCGVGREQGGAY